MQQGHCWGTKCNKSYKECLKSHGVDPILNKMELNELAARAQAFKDIGDVYGDTWRVWPGKE